MNSTPLGYLEAAGQRAAAILPLTWTTLLISIVVCIVIGVLLWLGVRRPSARGGAEETRAVGVERGGSGLRWISVGLMISSVPLLVTLVWTMVTLNAVAGPPKNPGLVLDVTGRQWWWEVRYDSDEPSQTFATANEIHIPVGVPVLVRLHGGDVIHSFWVPKLSGKTDAIPGQTNLSWMRAERPGRYLGQCSEFCGFQHAHMQFEVVAEPKADFDRWRAHQLQSASAPATPEQQRGLALVEYRCGLCHQVRGTQAGAIAGPDLTHVMSRQTLAAGTLPNSPGNLAGWILNPQALKPGTLMPSQGLSGQQLTDALAYLETLK
ncbi:MAG TPA: cytochrome c oxidase subunit II [Steroidobacteraceae bacterium]|jgi:cytochrome c oxidase subunit 2|nr:cytochrome c oxidase subunit II [Steroidobacteraceae bacterium]